MKAAKLTSSAAKLIPVAGPFIEGGAEVFYMALEPLKQMKGYIDRFLTDGTFSGIYNNVFQLQEVDGSTTRRIHTVFCAVSTNVQVQLLRSDGILSGASQTARRANDHIPEFEEFIELKQGHIQLQEEIKAYSGSYYYCDSHYYRAAPLFKEHHAVTWVNGNAHLMTVREYKGDAAGERLRADLRILARLKHRNITQVMGFCKSHIFPSIIFYEDLRPIGLRDYRSIDRSLDTLEDIFTKHRMRHNIRAGIDHIMSTIPSVFESEEVYEDTRLIYYFLKNTARLGIYIGSDNHPKLSILPSGMLDNVQHSEPLELIYDQGNILDEGILQALRIQFKGCTARRSQFEAASLLRHFHNIIPISHDILDLDSSVDGYRLGGVYAHYNQACQSCQGCLCITNPTNSPWIPHTMQLVANFSLETRVFYSDNWTLPTSTKENDLKHSTTSKGMRLSFTQSQWQKSETLGLIHCSSLKNDRQSQLYESFMAQLCHFNARWENERPSFQCKLMSLLLMTDIYWHIKVQLGNHTKVTVTWPVDEIFLFIYNPEISENGYIKRPNIYWSRCPEGSIRLTTLELHVFGVEAPRLTCDYWGAIFDSKYHNMKPLQEFYESFRLDPFSDDVARAAGALLPRHLNLRNSKQKRRHSFTPKNVRILQESSSHLGIRVPSHWQLLAAAEVLPESLRWYGLRTTGHEFEYGEVNMDPKYDELPSRCRDFMRECQDRGVSLEEMARRFKYRAELWYESYSDEDSEDSDSDSDCKGDELPALRF
ncbi:hypothetical protein M422DRAFT_255313 [Sphaerobolus stellatus SS14]|uniref:Protein kinase domain-containing protein n=1 Tax=Sphaerobolus stellatus (strain SS14) TaxID=990650 RepID=A0A0C9VJB4_SPHS4|nr:hypothetical protein M422DRAFT_255313 [Sphaerobolus stellatus SS14]